MTAFTVKEIWRYPVKSMQGERLEETVLTKGGIPFDRGWAVRDEQSRTIRGAKHIPGLLHCSARYLEGTSAGTVPHVEITLPDGSKTGSQEKDVNARLSKALEREVTLWPLQPAEDSAHYRINETAASQKELEANMRAMFGVREDETLPDLSAIPGELLSEVMEYASPRGTYFDLYPVNLLTEASLRRFQELTPSSKLDVRRFRPNFLIGDDEKLSSLAEFGWVGSNVKLGGAALDIAIECMRCVMTTREQAPHGQGAIPRDPEIMRTLVRETKHNLSVYANVASPGAVKVGDEVQV